MTQSWNKEQAEGLYIVNQIYTEKYFLNGRFYTTDIWTTLGSLFECVF